MPFMLLTGLAVIYPSSCSHVKKLERDKGGTKVYYEKELTEIMGKLDDFPKRLSLEQQGQFDLGYYHQQQEKYKKGEDK